MSATTKPSILIIGGGWHVPAQYASLSNALRAEGFKVYVPANPSVGASRPPTADLVTDTFNIRRFIEPLLDNGERLIVIAHSYGGQIATNALDGYDVASRQQAGQSDFGHMDQMAFFGMEDDNTCLPAAVWEFMTGAHVDEQEKKEYHAKMERWNGNCMYEPIQKCAWLKTPSTYVHTTQDPILPLDKQQKMVERANEKLKSEGRSVETVTLETAHCPNLTATKDMVEIVKGAATRY